MVSENKENQTDKNLECKCALTKITNNLTNNK